MPFTRERPAVRSRHRPPTAKAERGLRRAVRHKRRGTGTLCALKSVDRKADIFLGRPRKLSHRVTLKMPRKWRGEGWSLGEEAEGLSFFNRLRIEGSTLINERAITISNWVDARCRRLGLYAGHRGVHTNVLNSMARKRFGRIVSAASRGFNFNFGRA